MNSLLDLDVIAEERNDDFRYTRRRHEWQWPIGTRVDIDPKWGESRGCKRGTVIAYHGTGGYTAIYPRWYFLTIDDNPTIDGHYYLVADIWLTPIDSEAS